MNQGGIYVGECELSDRSCGHAAECGGRYGLCDIRLASIWNDAIEGLSMITAHEWYREYLREKAKQKRRMIVKRMGMMHLMMKRYDEEDMWCKGR